MSDWKVRDFVFPLVTVTRESRADLRFQDFLGSGFLIGRCGFCLTAAHVLPADLGTTTAALFVASDNTWRAHIIEEQERHPNHDVAILRLEGTQTWRSPFRLRNRWEGASANYQQFGYPVDALYDVVDLQRSRVVPRPDLVFLQGYIRRRFSMSLPAPTVRGDEFFELSELAGQGCSGSPLFIQNDGFWEVVGIYIGERLIEGGLNLGYAVREEAFRDWTPEIVRRSVLQESQDAVC